MEQSARRNNILVKCLKQINPPGEGEKVNPTLVIQVWKETQARVAALEAQQQVPALLRPLLPSVGACNGLRFCSIPACCGALLIIRSVQKVVIQVGSTVWHLAACKAYTASPGAYGQYDCRQKLHPLRICKLARQEHGGSETDVRAWVVQEGAGDLEAKQRELDEALQAKQQELDLLRGQAGGNSSEIAALKVLPALLCCVRASSLDMHSKEVDACQ